MRLSNLAFVLPLALLPLSTLANPKQDVSEFYALGCPKSTKPYASQREQLEALTRYGELLYVEQQVSKALETYVAAGYINHAPEVPGDGRDIAIATLTPMLKTSVIEIQRAFVGTNLISDFGVTHFKGVSSVLGVGVIADIVRMVGTCFVEHWDVAQGADASNTTNPHPYF